jgi:Calcineurin-like phosphoesterase
MRRKSVVIKLNWILLFTGIATSCFSQQVVDGPYVIYKDGKIEITTIEKNDDLLKSTIETYPETEKSKTVLGVIPGGKPDWTFKVKLRETINNDSISYPLANKTLFLSDIEGEFVNFRKILLVSKVIDEEYNWIYGNGSLVIAGDLFDRGKDVVPELWLLYKLEDDAKQFGGSVHVVLGNHDIMNLSGDHRYTDSKYFKNAWLLKTDCTGLFGRDTELGRWLRSKNVIIKVGDILVMHGGMSPVVANMSLSLEQLNETCRSYYGFKKNEMPETIQPLFNGTALFWYRGYFIQPKISEAGIDSTLKQYNCKYILVGHTIVKRNIAMYYKGKVIGIDVDEHTGLPSAALYESGEWWIIDHTGKRSKLEYKNGNDVISDKDIL